VAARPIRRVPVPVVLAAGVFQSLVSTWRAAPIAVAQLGIAGLFAIGVAYDTLGPVAAWYVLAATLLGSALRAVDVESYALFIPGGLAGRAREAFGASGARLAFAASLTERVTLAAVGALVAGHYIASLFSRPPAIPLLRGHLTHDLLGALLALTLICIVWLRERRGIARSWVDIARWVQAPLATLLAIIVWGWITWLLRGGPLPPLPRPPDFGVPPTAFGVLTPFATTPLLMALGLAVGLASTAFTLGSGDTLAQVAPNLPQPRITSLRRTIVALTIFSLIVTASGAFLCVALIPGDEWPAWSAAPLSGLIHHLALPPIFLGMLAVVTAIAAALILGQTVGVALIDVRGLLQRAAPAPDSTGIVTPDQQARAARQWLDAGATAVALAIVISGGRLAWLAHAYAACAVVRLLIKTSSLIRLRKRRASPLAFRVPLNVRFAGRTWALGLVALQFLLGMMTIAMIAVGDPAAIAGLAALATLFLLFTVQERRAARDAAAAAASDDQEALALLSGTELALDQVAASPGNILVAVRNPHVLAHLATVLREYPNRDIVVMTARLAGVDTEEDDAHAQAPTEAERFLFSRVLTMAEQHGRVVRLLIVPSRSAAESIVAAAVRLRSALIFVGESVTLSADDQARLVGAAWEEAEKPPALDVRLVVQHQSGGRSTYHLGAHPPTLTAHDLDLIHQVWLDAVKHIGPHVHHHDIVRAALTNMATDLHGPDRDDTLETIRRVARPADELASVLRTRDFTQLRDRVRNRPPGDLAALLGDLGLEDQVVVFRLLPRRTAAATFEYLSLDAQEALLKAMAQEDVAALLNDMAPDDRTMFLEELPAPVTRQLLALLTPEERSVAVALLGYPEGSIGRLMTPHYVAVREDWTVQAVLDYIRANGQDSETLNVIYVADENGLLIDDVRIREFLLTSPASRVSELMDRQFVALKATDDQETAVSVFRKYDRSALPVTDTAGMLIGIVTIDDVLDVAEAATTKEIQRIGGSEALDEPYMRISFSRMIRKRAGWLAALFLGETLTATAMGTFEQEIQKAVILAVFVPLIISSGGNSGSQASTLVIRALALGEVGLGDWWRVIRREVAAGLALGIILGCIGVFRITLWSAFSDIYGEHWVLVAITVGLSLVGIVLWGTLIGSLLPFVLRRLGFDPATSSAPFVATLVDVTGLVIYFTVALIVLRGTLL
jgi:magnesium transporter